jgi:hypothetical protein
LCRPDRQAGILIIPRVSADFDLLFIINRRQVECDASDWPIPAQPRFRASAGTTASLGNRERSAVTALCRHGSYNPLQIEVGIERATGRARPAHASTPGTRTYHEQHGCQTLLRRPSQGGSGLGIGRPGLPPPPSSGASQVRCRRRILSRTHMVWLIAALSVAFGSCPVFVAHQLCAFGCSDRRESGTTLRRRFAVQRRTFAALGRVSLFDLEARFFVATRSLALASCRAAVKAGRRAVGGAGAGVSSHAVAAVSTGPGLAGPGR